MTLRIVALIGVAAAAAGLVSGCAYQPPGYTYYPCPTQGVAAPQGGANPSPSDSSAAGIPPPPPGTPPGPPPEGSAPTTSATSAADYCVTPATYAYPAYGYPYYPYYPYYGYPPAYPYPYYYPPVVGGVGFGFGGRFR